MCEDIFDSIQSHYRENGVLPVVRRLQAERQRPTVSPETAQFYRDYWFERAWMISVGNDHFYLDT